MLDFFAWINMSLYLWEIPVEEKKTRGGSFWATAARLTCSIRTQSAPCLFQKLCVCFNKTN